MSSKEDKKPNKPIRKPNKPKKVYKTTDGNGWKPGCNPSFINAQVKKGEIRNPKGRPKGKASLIENLNKYLKRSAGNAGDEMRKLCEQLDLDPHSNVSEVIMAAFIHKTINSQNSGFMTEFMNRMLGKVPEQAQVDSEDIVKDVQEAIAQMQGLGAPDEEEGKQPEDDNKDDVQDYIDDMGTVDEETHHND